MNNDSLNMEAYKKARFRAEEPEGGWPESFGVVTACNPMGKVVPAKNAGQTARLQEALLEAGEVIFPVTGYDLESPFEEEGFGVVCSKEEILELGRTWKQLAVFWVEAGRVWLLSCKEGGGEWDLRSLEEMLGE